MVVSAVPGKKHALSGCNQPAKKPGVCNLVGLFRIHRQTPLSIRLARQPLVADKLMSFENPGQLDKDDSNIEGYTYT